MLSSVATVPTYSESLRIGWTLLWRGTGSFVLLLTFCNMVLFGVLPELARSIPSWWASLLPLVIVTCAVTFGIMLFVVGARARAVDFVCNSFGMFNGPLLITPLLPTSLPNSSTDINRFKEVSYVCRNFSTIV